jgi:hypothetical protein
MSITAEKVAEVLSLPEQDRAYLVHQLIASLVARAVKLSMLSRTCPERNS